MRRWLRIRSRVDRFVGVVVAAVVAIPIAVIAGLVRRDGGPGLVAITRIGRKGRVFRMWKVRTMVADEEGGRARGAPITSGDDRRVTALGLRLRRWRLDELPQVWNVVRGEMLLIGPRPEAPEFVDVEDEQWRAVLQAPPGIAGPTQLMVDRWELEILRGREPERLYREQVLPVKLAIDRWYVEQASPKLDALVLVSMVQRFALGRSRTVVERWVRRAVPAAGALP